MTYLSPAAMREARKFMASDEKGVRDEIGFLGVHQRYSDRFFPGTSVLHTKLRYVLFVPWIYQDEQMKPSKNQRTQESIKQREYNLTGRLINEPSGVIGSRNYPSPVDQRPSEVYWGALKRWGILREQEGAGAPSRHQVEQMVSAKRSTVLKDDEGTAIAARDWPFLCPQAPDEWKREGEGTLRFRLLPAEKTFLAKRLRSLTSPDNPGEKSIFARLVGEDVSKARNVWGRQVLQLAGAEQAALVRAGQVAALSAIGRAVYAAQVETLRDELDRLPTSDKQRRALPSVSARWRERAARLDWDRFIQDVDSLTPLVSEALRRTHDWVRANGSDPMTLEPAYRDAEQSRKGRRARLSRSQFGVDQRTEWDNEAHPPATPLHYRWDRVQMLLADLVEA
jgi:hypothetical protein